MPEQIRKLAGWICTPILLLVLVSTLVIWHPLVVLSKQIHPRLHKFIIELGSLFLLVALRIVGSSVKQHWATNAPLAGPVLIVSNHQSYFDIPIYAWIFRRYYVKFVAKESLGRGLPSISYILRTGGSALINRKDSDQALPRIAKLGRYVVEHGCAACIFPEGTRAKNGQLKNFKFSGLKILLAAAPGVPVVPVVISGAWKLMQYDLKPVPFGEQITVSVLDRIERASMSDEEIIVASELAIRAELERLTGTSDQN